MAIPTISVKDAAGATQTVNSLPNGGQATGANSLPVVLASDQATLPVGGNTAIVTASFNRPADTTAYAIGDLVADNVTAGSVTVPALAAARVNAGTGRITRARLKKSNASLTNASFRVHLYKSAPTLTNGDNGAWLTTESNYLGAFDITMDRAFSDGAKGIGVPIAGPFIAFDAGAGVQTIFALIEARAAYAPASAETFTLALEVDRD